MSNRIDGVQVAWDVDLSKANISHFAGSSRITALIVPKGWRLSVGCFPSLLTTQGRKEGNTVAIARSISYALGLLQIGEDTRDGRIFSTRAHYQS